MMKKIVIIFIGLYRALMSPLIGPACRFQPTCSEYAIEAVQIHGVCKGLWLAFKRIGRCHPMTKGNVYDPVPKANNNLKNRKSVYR